MGSTNTSFDAPDELITDLDVAVARDPDLASRSEAIREAIRLYLLARAMQSHLEGTDDDTDQP